MGDGEASDEPKRRVVDQRIRNRVIEYLESVASLNAQAHYAELAPAFVNVAYELIEEWEDWLFDFSRNGAPLPDVFSHGETEALAAFQPVWEAAAQAVPSTYPTLEEVQVLPEWLRMTDAAAVAVRSFDERGKLAEDHEVR